MNNIKIAALVIFYGLLMVALCLPLLKRKIKMNRWYGMRLPKAFKSEENWYKINEYGGKIFIYWSIPIVLIGMVMFFLPPLGEEGILVLCFAILFHIIATIQLLLYSRKI
ncbi:MAG: SdpI family protein [Candidatus Omnitrophota bacterium]